MPEDFHFRVTDVTAGRARQKAQELGLTLHNYLREIVERDLYEMVDGSDSPPENKEPFTLHDVTQPYSDREIAIKLGIESRDIVYFWAYVKHACYDDVDLALKNLENKTHPGSYLYWYYTNHIEEAV